MVVGSRSEIATLRWLLVPSQRMKKGTKREIEKEDDDDPEKWYTD
jgi:hypothetical protein